MMPSTGIITQNVVERVVNALRDQQPGLHISAEVIRKASEQYRLLETRMRVGSIKLQPASQKDSAERRAAALLEYCSRQQRLLGSCDGNVPSRPLSWSALAAAVHAKTPSPLQQLQHILISFLQPVLLVKEATKNQEKSKESDGRRTGNGASDVRSLRQRIHTINYKYNIVASCCDKGVASATTSYSTSGSKYVPRILPELVIRLTGHLVDPHGTQKLVCQLLHEIHTYYDHPLNSGSSGGNDGLHCYNNAAERRGHLYDLQRYAAAYEAAALYHVATTITNKNVEKYDGSMACAVAGGSKLLKTKTKKSIRKSKDEALNPDDDLVENNSNAEEDNDISLYAKDSHVFRTLQIDDLANACAEFTYLEIKQVLPRVQTLAKKIGERANRSPKSLSCDVPPEKKQSRSRAASLQVADHGRALKKQKQCKDSDVDVDQMESLNFPEANRQKDSDASEFQPSFVEWKEHVLSAAKANANFQFHNLRNSCDAEFSGKHDEPNDLVIAWLADAILRKYEIVH
jgi:hypothetical protein